MTAKKKTTKKAKKTAHRKVTPTKAKKRSKKLTKEKSAPKGAEKRRVAAKKQPRKKNKSVGELAFSSEHRGPRSGRYSGDFQGVSRLEAAHSETVDELTQQLAAFE